MSSYKRTPINIFGLQPMPEGRVGKKSERKDILSKLGEEACVQTPARSLYSWMADGYLSTADLCNLCCVSKQDDVDISRAIFAIIRLPLDGIWSHEPDRKGSLWLFLKAIREKVGRGVWADDMIKEIVIHDKKIPHMSALQKKPYVRVMTILLRVMESLTSLSVFRWDSRVPMSTSVFAVLSLHTTRLTECQFRIDSSAYQDLNSDGCILFDAIQDLDSEILKPTGSGDYSVPNDKRLGIKSTIVLQNATPRAILSLSKIISMHFYLIHKVDIIGPRGKALRRERFGKLQFEGGGTPAAIKVSHLRLVNINSAAGHFTQALDPKFLRDIQLDRCIQLQDIFSPLMRAKTAIEGLQVIFPPQQHDNGPVVSTKDVKEDQKAVSDLLRSAAMQLQHLTIGQPSYDDRSSQTDLLLAGIQPHFATLQELCLSDLEPKFGLNDLREIALCATWLRDLRIPLSKDILQPFIEILPEFRSLQVFGILDAALTVPERHVIMLTIQQACKHIPLSIIGIEDKKAGNWYYRLNCSSHNKNKLFPLNEAPIAKAINCSKDIGDFLTKMNHWAMQLGISVHGVEAPCYRGKRCHGRGSQVLSNELAIIQ